jgi:hypothetical protein
VTPGQPTRVASLPRLKLDLLLLKHPGFDFVVQHPQHIEGASPEELAEHLLAKSGYESKAETSPSRDSSPATSSVAGIFLLNTPSAGDLSKIAACRQRASSSNAKH